MTIGFVGLGKMGSQIVAKLLAAGHQVVVFDVKQELIDQAVQAGAKGASSREDLVYQLGDDAPLIWLMIPSEFVGAEVSAYADVLPGGGIIVDGGNSNYHESIRRAGELNERGLGFIDVGTSGGVMGLTNGFSMMVGGEQEIVARLEPFLSTLAEPNGKWVHTGGSGSGHYVKMIHNGIEYGLMQAYAEGYDLLKYGEISGLNLAAIADVWQHGSIIESRLNAWAYELLAENPELDYIDGTVADSGEGRWTLESADAARVGMPVLREALNMRRASQNGYHTFATRLLAGLRGKFGGHNVNGER